MISLIMCDSNFFLAKIETEGQFEAHAPVTIMYLWSCL